MYVYSGKTDVFLSFLLLPAFASSFGEWGGNAFVVGCWRVLTGILIAATAIGAWHANPCRWWFLLALPIKLVLTISAAVCAGGVVAGVLAALRDDSSKKRDRTENLLSSAACAFGLAVVWHWIKKLTRPAKRTHFFPSRT